MRRGERIHCICRPCNLRLGRVIANLNKPCPACGQTTVERVMEHNSSIVPEVSSEAVEFGRAMSGYMRRWRKLNLTCREVLAVAKSLGYRRM
jgi:hypothetical protein